MKRLPLVVLIAVVIAGCAGRMSPTLETYRQVPKTGKIDKFFFVVVKNKDNKQPGCTVDVQPKTNGAADYVKVKRNWRVAWFVLNTCEMSKDITPSIVFELKDSKTKKQPIRFEYSSPHVLIGKVRNESDCRNADSEVPCTTYKYTVFVGKDYEDPEIEIIEF